MLTGAQTYKQVLHGVLFYYFQEKRSEAYAPQWGSDEDNNEPLNKYPRLGGSQLELRLPEASCNLEERIGEDRNSAAVVDDTEVIIGGDPAVVCNTVSADATGLDEFGDWDMGQSHETESVFNQSVSRLSIIFFFAFSSGFAW